VSWSGEWARVGVGAGVEKIMRGAGARFGVNCWSRGKSGGWCGGWC
jgi:hypothetical protein